MLSYKEASNFIYQMDCHSNMLYQNGWWDESEENGGAFGLWLDRLVSIVIPMPLRVLALWIVQLGAENTCAVMGHDIEDYSDIGPDRGVEEWCCIRCGDSFHHVYY
jgi:hypothetical protein